MAGEPLLRGVSFKLERRERLTIAGRNGAGKTTLLRMLSGETSIDGGELVLSKGVRVALHDQRPPRERDISLREYVLSGCREPLELEEELGRLETAMAAGDEAALNRYSDVYARFEAAGGYGWRERARSVVHGLGFADADLDRALKTFSGGQLTRASLARALAARARPAAARRADEPPRHRVARVARGGAARPRRGRHPRRPRPLVPRDRRHGRARARGRPRAVLQRHLAQLAPRAGGPRDGARQGDRQAGGRDRADGAVHRALPLQGLQGAPGPVARQEARQDRAHHARSEGRPRARVLLQAAGALGPGDLRARRGPPGGRSAGQGPARRRRAVARARRARVARRAERHRQDDAARGAHRRARARRRQAAQRPQRQDRLPQPAHRGAGGGRRAHGPRGLPEAHRAAAEPGARAARPLPVQRRGGREAARRPERRRAPAAVARRARVLGRERPDPRRADEPPRPRVARGARGRAAAPSRARCCSSPTTGRCSTRSGRARSRSRTRR